MSEWDRNRHDMQDPAFRLDDEARADGLTLDARAVILSIINEVEMQRGMYVDGSPQARLCDGFLHSLQSRLDATPPAEGLRCSAVWNGCRCGRKPHKDHDDRHVWMNTLDDGAAVDPALYPATPAAEGPPVVEESELDGDPMALAWDATPPAEGPDVERPFRADLLAQCLAAESFPWGDDPPFYLAIAIRLRDRYAALAPEQPDRNEQLQRIVDATPDGWQQSPEQQGT